MKWRKSIPYIVGPLLFLIIAYAYFLPLLSGKYVAQHDREQWHGTARELIEYSEEHDGEQSLWTNTLFSGMPSILVSLSYPKNVMTWVDSFFLLGKRPASYIFLTMLGFFLLLLVAGVEPLLAIPGAIAYGLSTYFFIIVGAGHNAKSHAIIYAAPMIAGVILAYKGRWILGSALFALMMGLNLVAGHPQITYYVVFILAAVAIGYLFETIKSKKWRRFIVASVALFIAAIMALGANFNRLYNTWDYGKESIRGPSELTASTDDATSGLDKSYALGWSYGIGETFNLVVPNLMGGSSSLELPLDSHTGRFFQQQTGSQAAAKNYMRAVSPYWGPQPMTSGPVYIGAVVFFLFLLALFLLKGPQKIALLVVTALAIMLAWGSHMEWLSNLFLNYFPGYNKFRTVSMILFIAEVTIPFLAFVGLSRWADGKIETKKVKHSLKWAAIISSGLLILILIIGSISMTFSPSGPASAYEASMPVPLIEALRADRAALFRVDVFRSLILVLVAAAILYFFLKRKIAKPVLAVTLAAVILIDMVVVNKRYDGVHYVEKSQYAQPFQPTVADMMISRDTTYYRVFNTTVSPFNDASTSYFHNSVGGYHGAKLRRYQEFINEYVQKPIFLNLLNVKYVIQPSEDRKPTAALNTRAYGPAWFVDQVEWADNADEELRMVGERASQKVAVVDKRFSSFEQKMTPPAEGDTIYVTQNEANSMEYRVRCAEPRFVVFSEIYYPKGWKLTVDGKQIPIVRTDYILRGAWLPAGDYIARMDFDLPAFHAGQSVDLIFGLLIVIALVGALVYEFWLRRQEEPIEGKAEEL